MTKFEAGLERRATLTLLLLGAKIGAHLSQSLLGPLIGDRKEGGRVSEIRERSVWREGRAQEG